MADQQTIVVQVTPAPPSEENVASISELTLLFFGAAVVIWCAKQLLKLFSIDSHND
ncbi:MAG: hypothetical protein PBV86_19415 [Delftia lacustris]|uniref:hypothetical protein n=1 Tax=Delftia TaxID=80865 RepID=UPI00187B2844|nr:MULTISPECIES: hypothetical protein [Delftia]